MRKLALAAGLLCVTFTGAAFGSGYYVPKAGGDTAGPTTANGSALFWNPAAMSLIDGHSVFLEVQPVWRKNTYESSEPGQSGVANNTRWNVLPAAAATFTLSDRFKAGVGLFFPYGLGEDFKPSNGSQRYSIIYADLRSMFIMPSVSFDATKITTGASQSQQDSSTLARRSCTTRHSTRCPSSPTTPRAQAPRSEASSRETKRV